MYHNSGRLTGGPGSPGRPAAPGSPGAPCVRRKGGRKGGREGGREGGWEGGREGGREERREERREGGREVHGFTQWSCTINGFLAVLTTSQLSHSLEGQVVLQVQLNLPHRPLPSVPVDQ